MDPVLDVRFFATGQGTEPVRQWLRELNHSDRKIIGEEIKTVQFGWPLGMPLVRKLERDLWEIRATIPSGIVRILFTTLGGDMILLHAFAKKSQKTPPSELKLARDRMKELNHDRKK